MEKELQKEFSEQIGKDLRKSAFREFANAAFDASKISEVETLRENKSQQLDGFRKELEGVESDPENHKRELRDKADGPESAPKGGTVPGARDFYRTVHPRRTCKVISPGARSAEK